ncbi:MAG: aromatic amino acid DMT transporter YddG [Planctomycetota bacterium]
MTHSSSDRTGTVLGILALVFWSTSIAFVRDLSKDIGPLTLAAYNYLLSGVVSLIWAARAPGGLKAMFRLPPLYLYGCGAIFILYTVAYYLAVGSASTDAQIPEILLINYLWPSLTLLLAVPILGQRARWPILVPGLLIALAGVVLAMTQRGGGDAVGFLARFVANVRADWFPYAAAFVGAVTWSVYSNLVRRWGGTGGAVPLFFLGSGIVIFIMRLFRDEPSHWTAPVIALFLATTFFTTILAYMFWDRAMRTGNVVLLAVFSHGLPLVATFATCIVLNLRVGGLLWVACGLVILGAALCTWSTRWTAGNTNIEARNPKQIPNAD